MTAVRTGVIRLTNDSRQAEERSSDNETVREVNQAISIFPGALRESVKTI